MTSVAVIEVLDPTGKAILREYPLAPRLASLEGKVAGFLDNTKPNADLFLERVQELLVAKYRFSRVVAESKAAASSPTAGDQIERLIEQCDLVISAWGD
ncbi:MAG: hypothetical protein EXR51_06630 [Dehalococcoidia bacterium]|nr:hypothetical protein [Dehalococcoidia bacterium]